jgi:hypothetical protein
VVVEGGKSDAGMEASKERRGGTGEETRCRVVDSEQDEEREK